jgi:hypothetical protein
MSPMRRDRDDAEDQLSPSMPSPGEGAKGVREADEPKGVSANAARPIAHGGPKMPICTESYRAS